MSDVIRFGYGLSHDSSDRHNQHRLLSRAGCRVILFDNPGKATELGKVFAELRTYPASLRPTLTVCSLDTAAPNLTSLIDLILVAHKNSISFHALTEGWHITPVSGLERLQTLRDLAAFRRKIATKKSRLGVRAAEDKQRHTGRPRSLDDGTLRKAAQKIRDKKATVAEMAREMDVSIATLYRNLSALKTDTG